ncbi:MAG: class I SAM-dependent methyltransferase [Bacteroidota bacterium]
MNTAFMNWEDTILYLRSTAYYRELLRDSYLDADLVGNAKRFEESGEFKETLRQIKIHHPTGNRLLDVGAGNGIASVAFAKNGFSVTALEPDPSETVGAKAIQKLADELSSLQMVVVQGVAEKMPFDKEVFDIVYVRQAMHHAADLNRFLMECARVLKPGGILFTVRDHVIYNHKDKERFLKEHPLHKYYGGENAFTDPQYRHAIEASGLQITDVLRHFDSIINYFPLSTEDLSGLKGKFNKQLNNRLQHKIGFFAGFRPFRYIYQKAISVRFGGPLDEKRIPGRLYSYIARKPLISSNHSSKP